MNKAPDALCVFVRARACVCICVRVRACAHLCARVDNQTSCHLTPPHPLFIHSLILFLNEVCLAL